MSAISKAIIALKNANMTGFKHGFEVLLHFKQMEEKKNEQEQKYTEPIA